MFFSFLKSKPTLKELIPNGFVDIHSHILPGIDDGAVNLKESLDLVKEMKKLGFGKLIGTPHTYPGLYENTSESIKNSFEVLKTSCKTKIKLSYASEYFIDYSMVNKNEIDKYLTLDDKHILLETGFIFKPNCLFDVIFGLIISDYIPVLAHPERYLYLTNDLKTLKKLKDMGCKFQINLLSTTDYYGKKITNFADVLISEGYLDFAGSDIHNFSHVSGFDKKVLIKNIDSFEKIINKNEVFN
tara:strand:+ start:78 stop:806 length:729 start_codon:yes stop_codon:yes gene_type:complete